MHDGIRKLSNLTAVVLAGGLGARLRSVVPDRPKVLAEIGGRPFLTYLLDQIATTGIKRVVLCTGYLAEQVRSTLGASYKKLDLIYSEEQEPLNTGGALRFALPLLGSDPVLAMNGDSFCEVDLSHLWYFHCRVEATGTLVVVRAREGKRYGGVKIASSGLVATFNEKSDSGDAEWINAGVYLLTRRLVLGIPERTAVSLEREIFPAWAGQGLYAYQCHGNFLDIGTPGSYKEAQRFFENSLRNKGRMA